MASTAGRKCKVYWSADDSNDSYSLVQGIDTFQGGPESPEITDDEFGVEYEQSITGIIGFPFTLSGGLRTGDTNGQMAMLTALLAGTSPNGYLIVLYAGASPGFGLRGAVNLTKFTPDTKTRDKTNVTIEGKTTGVFTYGSVTIPVT